VQRGATWKGVKLKCNGKSAAGTIVPFCYSGILYSFTVFVQNDQLFLWVSASYMIFDEFYHLQ